MHWKNPCARINFLNGLVEFIALEGIPTFRKNKSLLLYMEQ